MKHITLFAAMACSVGAMAQINDGGFEAGIGAGTWNEASATFGTPICDEATCGTGGGPCVPHTGDFYVWFGGAGNADEIASVDQDATIPSGSTAMLVGYVKIAAVGDGTAGNYLKAYIDGNEVGMVTAEDSAEFADYTLVSVPIDAYADGATHNVKLEGKENGGSTFNILVDDVALVVDGNPTGLFENESQPGVSVYPNPANRSINLSFNALRGGAVVDIMDIAGKVVGNITVNEVSRRTLEFDASGLSNGLYFVSVNQAGKRYTQRVQVAH
ncbi:MAG: T9SS type A sorting domain-containing protein [Bacteroidetes bacterium]|nr:T9SS type A sorting domain-containing protein [Bacteroidota bacterium]